MAKILIVDDDRNLADTIAELLGHHGYDACVAYDGDDALTQAALEPPQSVLLDLGLPAIDGIEVAHQTPARIWRQRSDRRVHRSPGRHQ